MNFLSLCNQPSHGGVLLVLQPGLDKVPELVLSLLALTPRSPLRGSRHGRGPFGSKQK